MNQELAANTTLSHYRILSKIGAGGMGEVHLAQDTKLPDGRSIAFVVNKGAVGNIWSQGVDVSPPKQITNFTSEIIDSFA